MSGTRSVPRPSILKPRRPLVEQKSILIAINQRLKHMKLTLTNDGVIADIDWIEDTAEAEQLRIPQRHQKSRPQAVL